MIIVANYHKKEKIKKGYLYIFLFLATKEKEQNCDKGSNKFK